MRKSLKAVFAAAVLPALAVPMFAGGFFVLLGNPEASSEARSHNAFLTIKAAGCHDAAKASVAASAIGIVDGRRQNIPLKLVPLSEPGMYAVARQWPADGRWVLQFVGTDQNRITSTLVRVGPAGIERQTAKFSPSQPAPEDVAAVLNGAPALAARK